MAATAREPTSESCWAAPPGISPQGGLSLPPELGPFLLDSGDETLCAPAFGAFVDPVHKARLFRFGAGKQHLRATLDTEQALKRIFLPLVCDIAEPPG
jgi:hypothetical protein